MGLGSQVRLKWLIIAGYRHAYRRGALRCVASGGAKGRSESGRGGEADNLWGVLAVSGLTGEAVTPGQELGEADQKLPG